MTRWFASFVLTVALAALAAFMAVRLVDEARLLGQAAAVETGVVDDSLALALARGIVPPEPAPPNPSGISEVLDRPLFSPTRRPPVRVAAEQAPQPAAAGDLPELKLRGIVVVGEARMALVGGDPSAPLRRVRAGDKIGAWRVIEIGADTLVLTRGDETHRVRLDYRTEAE